VTNATLRLLSIYALTEAQLGAPSFGVQNTRQQFAFSVECCANMVARRYFENLSSGISRKQIVCYNSCMKANLFAVIHSRERTEACANAELAIKCGMNGVFFISHGDISSEGILEIAKNFKKEHDDVAVGVNLLGESVQTAISDAQLANLDMVWTDETPSDNDCRVIRGFRDMGLWRIKWYGGVAFKYQPQPEDLTLAAKEAIGVIDMLTTSGVGTGSAPDIEKLKTLSEGFGQRVAVASGASTDNIAEMLPYVGDFLIATSISKDFYNLDEDKCLALVNAARSAEEHFLKSVAN
jgi:predicted TIM-barrel enzyme